MKIIIGIYAIQLLLSAVQCSISHKSDFNVGSFNVQIFGQSKGHKGDVMDTLAQIVQRYDILLIQEVRDSSGTVVDELVELTNSLGPAIYDYVMSERLGRSNSKEQYAFLFRSDAGISVLETYQYPVTEDLFERPPFAVKYQSINTDIQEFVLAGVHVSPGTAVEEINSLPQVFTDLVNYFDTQNVIVMGDFNCDCGYVSNSKKESLTLRTPEYTWLIGDDADTTTKNSDCAYDRVVVHGDTFVDSIVKDSAQVYRFDLDYQLTYDQTIAVSDHYPIEFQLWTKSVNEECEESEECTI